ncbi:MAG: transposase [Flavobacteriales bacterium]|nr:transposase [Flavobacteriales bacterium]
MDIATPRDRAGTFEPQLVGKRQRVLNAELDQKILGLYSLGMSYRDISRHLREIMVETNEALINAVTELVVEDLRAWQSRPWTACTCWCGWTQPSSRSTRGSSTTVLCTVLGVDMQGRKDVLGTYIEETEARASGWASRRPQQRGVQDILISPRITSRASPKLIEAITLVPMCRAASCTRCVIHAPCELQGDRGTGGQHAHDHKAPNMQEAEQHWRPSP